MNPRGPKQQLAVPLKFYRKRRITGPNYENDIWSAFIRALTAILQNWPHNQALVTFRLISSVGTFEERNPCKPVIDWTAQQWSNQVLADTVKLLRRYAYSRIQLQGSFVLIHPTINTVAWWINWVPHIFRLRYVNQFSHVRYLKCKVYLFSSSLQLQNYIIAK